MPGRRLTDDDKHNLLTLVLQGLPYEAVARHLGITRETVRIHARENGLTRYGDSKRQQRARAAIASGVAAQEGTPYTPPHGWWDQAACAGYDPEMWWPQPGDHDTAMEAATICAGCPVRKACLADAVAAGDKWSIRGGITGPERGRQVAS